MNNNLLRYIKYRNCLYTINALFAFHFTDMYSNRYMWIWSNDVNASMILQGDLPYTTTLSQFLYYYYCAYTPLEQGTC